MHSHNCRRRPRLSKVSSARENRINLGKDYFCHPPVLCTCKLYFLSFVCLPFLFINELEGNTTDQIKSLETISVDVRGDYTYCLFKQFLHFVECLCTSVSQCQFKTILKKKANPQSVLGDAGGGAFFYQNQLLCRLFVHLEG